jgi:excisionase family DNA binding protein
MLDNYPEVMTAAQMREELGIGRDLAYEGLKSGQIPHVRIGGKYLINKQSLIRMLEGGNATEEPG